MLMPTTEATTAMALAMVLAMAMVDMDLAMDMEDMVDTVLDSMARERLSLATMAITVTREAMDTEPGDTTATARGRLMLSPATMDITVTREDTDTGPGDTDTTTARGRPSLDMVTVMDTRDVTMAMVTVSTMDKKAED